MWSVWKEFWYWSTYVLRVYVHADMLTRGLRGAVVGAGLYVLFEQLLCQFYGI